VSGGDGPCKASASGVQRAAGGEQRAAGGWRGASSRAGQQSGVGGTRAAEQISKIPGRPDFRIYSGTSILCHGMLVQNLYHVFSTRPSNFCWARKSCKAPRHNIRHCIHITSLRAALRACCSDRPQALGSGLGGWSRIPICDLTGVARCHAFAFNPTNTAHGLLKAAPGFCKHKQGPGGSEKRHCARTFSYT
jgi:hypothetical protein